MADTAPQAVQKQKEEADRLADEFFSEENTETSTVDDTDASNIEAGSEETLLSTEPTEPTPELEVSTEDVVDPNSQAPEEIVQETPVQPVVDDAWELKYNVLKGKYDAEVPRLTREVKTLSDKLDIFSKIIDEKNDSSKVVAAPQVPEELAQFKEDYPEMYKAMMTMVRTNQPNELIERLTTLEMNNERTSDNVFYSFLDQAVPDWRDVNEDSAFLSWLQGADGYSGNSLYDSLNNAFQVKDATRVSKFFNDFKSIHSPSALAAPPAQAPVKPTSAKEKRVAPTTGAKRPAPQTVSAEDKLIYKKQEIDKFYMDAAHGRLKHMDPAERKAKEQEYWNAGVEGRVLP